MYLYNSGKTNPSTDVFFVSVSFTELKHQVSDYGDAVKLERWFRIPAATDQSRKKQVVTTPLSNARKRCASRPVLGDDYHKRMPRVKEVVARLSIG